MTPVANQIILLIIIFVVTLLILTVIFVKRHNLFGHLSKLSPEEADERGFGKYVTTNETECTNKTGKCSEVGFTTETQMCLPHPKTRRGCLDSNGLQTFATKVIRKKCLTMCKNAIWEFADPETPACIPPPQNNAGPCIDLNNLPPSSIKGTRTINYRCMPNDASGINGCTFICGGPDGYIQGNNNKCQINLYDANGNITGTSLSTNIVSFNLGDEIALVEPCFDFEGDFCGSWGHRNVVSGGLSAATYACAGETGIKPLGTCRGNNGVYSQAEDLFRFGWDSTPLTCLKSIQSSLLGVYDTTKPPEEAICFPLSEPNCLQNNGILDHFHSTGEPITRTLLCSDPVATTQPGCASPCFFAPSGNSAISIAPWHPAFDDIIGKPFYIKFDDFILMSNHIPCNIDPTNSLTKQIKPVGQPSYFFDCMGDPSSPLNSVSCSLINLGNDPSVYGRYAGCDQNRMNEESGLLLFVRPTSDNPNPEQFMKCNIFAVIGGSYFGWLRWNQINTNIMAVNGGVLSYLSWDQAIIGPVGSNSNGSSGPTNLDGPDPGESHVFTLLNNNGTYILGNALYGLNRDDINIIVDNSVTTEAEFTQRVGMYKNLTLQFPLAENFEQIDIFLSLRGTRCRSDICNVSTFYPPYRDYQCPDAKIEF